MLRICDKTHASIERYRDNSELEAALSETAKVAATSNKNRNELIAVEDELENLDRLEDEATETAALEGAASGKINVADITKIKAKKAEKEAEYAVKERIQKKLNERLPELKKAENDIRYRKGQQLEAAFSQFLADNGVSKGTDAKVSFDQIKDLSLAECAMLAEAFSVAHFRVHWLEFLEMKCTDSRDYHGTVAKTAHKNLYSLLGL